MLIGGNDEGSCGVTTVAAGTISQIGITPLSGDATVTADGGAALGAGGVGEGFACSCPYIDSSVDVNCT